MRYFKMTFARPRIIIAIALAGGACATALVVKQAPSASAEAASPGVALEASSVPIAERSSVTALLKYEPDLVLDDAQALMSTPTSDLWRARTTQGQVCMIEEYIRGADLLAGFECKPQSAFERDGIVAGPPG